LEFILEHVTQVINQQSMKIKLTETFISLLYAKCLENKKL